MNSLIEFLNNIPDGPIEDVGMLTSVLQDSWDRLKGSDSGGMVAYKLSGRVENPRWNPPMLTFIIERHGGTVMGSSRAELQHWQIDTERNTAEIVKMGHRQLSPQAPRWTQAEANDAADNVAHLIMDGKEDELLSWLKNGGVKVNISKIVPDIAAKQTIIGRRKRFWKSLDHKLSPYWSRSANIYRKVDRNDD